MEQNSNQVPQKQIPETPKINTLIILGNGYDLTYGYKTNYSDFIKSDYFTRETTDNDLFWRITKKKEYEDWSDLEALLYDHAKELERELNQVALPDNGIAPLPKKGEAGELITDFKNEYGSLRKQLCEFLNAVTQADPTDPKKIKIEDYSLKDIYYIFDQFIGNALTHDISDSTYRTTFSTIETKLPIINEQENNIIDENIKLIEAYLNPHEDTQKDYVEAIKSPCRTIRTKCGDILKKFEEINLEEISDNFAKFAIMHIKEFISQWVNNIQKAAKFLYDNQDIDDEDKITSYFNQIKGNYNAILSVYRIKKNIDKLRNTFKKKYPDYSKQKKIINDPIEALNEEEEQKNTFRFFIAYYIYYRRTIFEKLQKKWTSLCSLDSHVLTFNYTDLPDCIRNYFTNEKQIIRVHGKLKDNANGEENTKIVLGIDESMKVHRAFNFLHKSYQEGLNIIDLSNKLQNTKRFIIYGCSIGCTDKWYFNQIFKDTEGHITKKHVFEIYYYNNDARESLQNCITNIVGNLMDFQTKNFVRWIRVEGTGLETALNRREELDKEELEYLELL